MKKKTAVIIFCKYPEPGKVKTRLTLSGILSAEDGSILAEAMLKDSIRIALRSKADFLILGYSPKSKKKGFRDIYDSILQDNQELGEIPLVFFPQHGSNFDERFQSIVEQAFNREFTHLIILGADLPFMPPAIINKSLDLLGYEESDSHIVLGPAGSGGIYLVGINRSFDPSWFTKFRLFRGGIEIYQFSALFTKNKFSFHLLPPYNDVDIEEDLISIIVSLETLRSATSSLGMDYPKYFARAVDQLGLRVEVGDTHNRSRKLQKVKSYTADH